MTFMLDCSHYQGQINFAQVKADGCIGVVIKTTDGSSGVDANWQTNHAGARAAGLPCSPYHFSEDGNPATEAAHFASVWSAGWDFRPWLDEELATSSSAYISDFRSTWRSITSYSLFGVYSSEGFLAGKLAPSGWIDAETGIWAARYASSLGWSHPQLLAWQYSSAATIPGVLGHVDESEFMNGWTPAADHQGANVVTGPVELDPNQMLIGYNWNGSQKAESLANLLGLAEANYQNISGQGGWLTDQLNSIVASLSALSGALSTDDAAILGAVAGVDSDVKNGVAQLVTAISGVSAGQVNVQALAEAIVPLLAPVLAPDDATALLAAMKTLLDGQASASVAPVTKPTS
jgi:lysozyme